MLDQYRVLDLTDERGHIAGFMLAQMGAEVIAIEGPEGSPARKLAPFAHDVESEDTSLHHWAYNRGKKSVVLDITTTQGQQTLKDLAAGADILIESSGTGTLNELGLGYQQLSEINPSLIYVSITAFGSEGPKATWVSSDISIQASAGNMVLTGEQDRAPLRAGGTIPQAYANAASEAVGAALIAMHERQTVSGLGQHIDISAQQSMNQATQSSSLATPLGASLVTRIAGGVMLNGMKVQLMWPCTDGYVSVSFLFGPSFGVFSKNLMDWIFEEGFCDEPTRDKNWFEYAFMLVDGRETPEEYERVKQVIGTFLLTKSKDELLAAALSRRLLITPITTTAEVANSEQLDFRDYWEYVEQGEHGTIKYPGPFAKFSESPLTKLSAPPTLGEHTKQILEGPQRNPTNAVKAKVNSTARPLEGLKILDFMWAMAGPAASRVLADYGAQIVRVESSNKIDAVRTLAPFPNDVADPELSGIFHNMNAGKRGLTLDMGKPGATDVVWDLIEWADVIMESFSPKAMVAWGIDYAQIAERYPEKIMTSSCLMGQTGPLSLLAGFGTMASAISGFFYPVGWADRPPCGPYSAYTDYTSPRWLVASVMGALEHKRRTGDGQYVDLSQAEAALHLMSAALLEYSINDRIWERAGNRDLVFAPNGVYATAGEDRWIAITCTNDSDWLALVEEMKRPDLASITVDERHRRHDEIDEIITQWSALLEGEALMHRLQELGIASHVVQNSPELLADPQLIHRNQFVEVNHPSHEPFFVDGTRFKLSRTPAEITDSGPNFGQHTFEILADYLKYDGDKIAELAIAELLE